MPIGPNEKPVAEMLSDAEEGVQMPIGPKELYDQAFQSLRHASDFRAGIMAAWLATYVAFAGLFVWVQEKHPLLTCAVTFLVALVTRLMWLAERRNRQAIKFAKEIGRSIEKDPDLKIPPDRCFFCGVEKEVGHSTLIARIFRAVSHFFGVEKVFGVEKEIEHSTLIDIFGAVSLFFAVAAFFVSLYLLLVGWT